MAKQEPQQQGGAQGQPQQQQGQAGGATQQPQQGGQPIFRDWAAI